MMSGSGWGLGVDVCVGTIIGVGVIGTGVNGLTVEVDELTSPLHPHNSVKTTANSIWFVFIC